VNCGPEMLRIVQTRLGSNSVTSASFSVVRPRARLTAWRRDPTPTGGWVSQCSSTVGVDHVADFSGSVRTAHTSSIGRAMTTLVLASAVIVPSVPHNRGVAYDLERFVAAQEPVYHAVLAELHAGRKTGHWMWFVFPQVAGLGQSELSRFYAIAKLDEARAYLAHPVLGPRLRECASIVAGSRVASAEDMFGPIDAVKLCSSMTLFLRADPNTPVFSRVLDRWFDGEPDPATDARLA